MTGYSLSQLGHDELRLAIDTIILQGTALAGAPPPVTDEFAEVLSDELSSFLLEFGYENLTVSEVIAAFRLNMSGIWKWPSGEAVDKIEFSGFCFNVNYVSKILNVYLSIRNNLDGKLKNKLLGY